MCRLPCESRRVSGGGGAVAGSAGIGGSGRSMLAAADKGAGGGADGGPAPGRGIGRSSGDPPTELPDTELRDVAFVSPGRQTDWNIIMITVMAVFFMTFTLAYTNGIVGSTGLYTRRI